MVMTQDPALPRLRTLLHECTGIDPARLSAASSSKNTPDWDSVANLSFIAAVEEEFHIAVDTQEALRLQTLGDWARFVNQRAPAPPEHP